ncbi:fused MFS/spermidine synthase [Massilia sp. TS11]|uniref:fused MFS/spermidine synthase n=1 Tax=Massilia sp. TS11 TaxID=2908003 RepID=UPI001EDAC617|nr:fused MFS/spermidine synthase [Massilia sp. TS11]MCG2584836.1 fused MFS/spermidine synthase [Massilia sp. TS11]
MHARRFDQPGYPPATTTEDHGVLYLHLGTSWIQGAMRLARPDAIELAYVQMMMMWMLFQPAPRRIAQLGLGSGALAKFCYHQFPQAEVHVAELNPNVIAICESHFGLPPNDARLHVRERDARAFVEDPAQHGRFDILQVDLYDEHARAPVFGDQAFYQACADCLTADGIMTTNVFGEIDAYQPNLEAMSAVFDAVVWLPEVDDANIIVIAFKRAPQVDFSELYRRAAQIRKRYNLKAESWVDGFKSWMEDHG